MCYNKKVFFSTSMNMQFDLDGENMKVTKEDLENVAVLSRLSVPEGKAETYIQQMDSIRTYMDNLSKVDTDNVKPTTYALPMRRCRKTAISRCRRYLRTDGGNDCEIIR